MQWGQQVRVAGLGAEAMVQTHLEQVRHRQRGQVEMQQQTLVVVVVLDLQAVVLEVLVL
jgi:hypothetical protein